MSDQLPGLPDESAPPRAHAAELNRQLLPPSPEWARSLPSGPDHRVKITEAYAKLMARDAYFWAWPLVNIFNRRQAFKDVTEIVMAGPVPTAPLNRFAMLTDYITPDQRLVACPNQDVVYGAGALALDITPVVIQVPDFGGRFWVYQVVDLRTDGVVQLGKMYGTTPGFYIVVGPDWHAETPKGITKVFRSGGLTAREIIRGVRIAARDGFAGFDLVEVSPDFDSASGTTSILAARLLAEALFSLAAHRAGRPDCWRSAHLNVLTADAAPSPQQP